VTKYFRLQLFTSGRILQAHRHAREAKQIRESHHGGICIPSQKGRSRGQASSRRTSQAKRIVKFEAQRIANEASKVEAENKCLSKEAIKAEAEAGRLAKEQAKTAVEAEAEAKRIAKVKAKRIAKEAVKAEAEAKCLGAAEAKHIVEFEAKRIVDEATKAEAEIKRLSKEAIKAEAVAKHLTEKQAKTAAEAAKAEIEARLKAEQEAISLADEESRRKAADEPRLKSAQEAMLRAEDDARRKTEEGVGLTQEVQQKSKEAKVKSEEVANLKAALEAVERTYDLLASIDDVLESNTTTSSMRSYLSGLEQMQATSDKDSSTMPSSQGSNLDDLAKQDKPDNADSKVTRSPSSSGPYLGAVAKTRVSWSAYLDSLKESEASDNTAKATSARSKDDKTMKPTSSSPPYFASTWQPEILPDLAAEEDSRQRFCERVQEKGGKRSIYQGTC
jgi:hypothetical protein